MQTFIALHIQAIFAIVTGLCFAFISSMPAAPPTSISAWWTWIRESLQTLLPTNRFRNHQDNQEEKK